MAALTLSRLGPDTGLVDLAASAATAAAGGGDTFGCQGRELLVVNNGGVSSINVTITANADNFGVTNAAHNLVVAVAAGKTAIIGPLSPVRFRDANGNANVSYSAVTSVTVGVYAPATAS
jgi:hypothetical protein